MGPKIIDLNPILSKNTRPVAAIKSLGFALFIYYYLRRTAMVMFSILLACVFVCLCVCNKTRERIFMNFSRYMG